jgi:HEAT repeat protein
VRHAAFRLVERLSGPRLADLLARLAQHADSGVARPAIAALGAVRAPAAVPALLAVLDAAREPDRVVACVQALVQHGDRAAVPHLEAVLAARRFPFGPPLWSDHVRSAAQYAVTRLQSGRRIEDHAAEPIAAP